MIPAEKIADILRRNLELMETLKGKNLIGFALIIPPTGEAIEFQTLGSQSDEKSFYKYLSDKLSANLEASQMGGVGMPRGMR